MQSSNIYSPQGAIADSPRKKMFKNSESEPTIEQNYHDKENVPRNIIHKIVASNMSPKKIVSPILTRSVRHLNRAKDSSYLDPDNAVDLSTNIHSSPNVVVRDQYPKVNNGTSRRPESPPSSSLVINPQVQMESDMDESCEQSPNTTILKLKKGQRVKDGMILMLSGQVDRRKQLLLGAQVFSSSYSVSDVIILAVFNVINFCCI